MRLIRTRGRLSALARSLSEVCAWVLRRRMRFQVTGCSMAPALLEGDWVFVDPAAFTRGLPRVGDVVLVRHPEDETLRLVKRVFAVTDNRQMDVRGDNVRVSTDSRSFGLLDEGHILGRVEMRIPGLPRGSHAPSSVSRWV